jgi:hypothetical protein
MYTGGADMPKRTPSPDRRRMQISEEIGSITTMQRGSLNEFYYEQTLKDGTKVKRGPFYNVTTKDGKGKTVSKAVSKSDVADVRREVENYRRFKMLADEYVKVCELLSAMAQYGEVSEDD